MESANRPSFSLPPINHLQPLDMDKVKQEQEYQQRKTGTAGGSMPSSTAESPTYQYPNHPPPPYTQPAPPPTTTNNHTAAPPSVHTPPGSRRTSGDEKEQSNQQPKQSLPSIHEALGVEQPASYPAQPPYPPATQTYGPPAPPSPSPSSRRSFALEPPTAPPQPYSQPPPSNSYPAAYAQDRSPRELLHPSQDAQRSSYLHPLPAGRSPPREAPRPEPPHSYPPPGPAPATHDRAPPSAMAPPQSFPYGYTPYPPQYTYPTPASSVYQPSVTQPAPGAPASAWKAEKPLPPPGASQAAYGDSVKRHLNFYDFEAALNDIAENSGVTLDFSRQYGARMHQMQRSGPLPGSMPAITEIDDLANKTRNTLEALSRMREVLLAEQQAAYYQQAQEQRYKAEDDAKHHDAASQLDDKAGGFAGAESKKRRGRAAPPGRCHSCNRAETPEWRRGPDGARTLCNACGLHYAKLTRKAGGNKAAIGSSNLRPKAGETSS